MVTATTFTFSSEDFVRVNLNLPTLYRDRILWLNRDDGIGSLPLDFFQAGYTDSQRKFIEFILFEDGACGLNFNGAFLDPIVARDLTIDLVASSTLSVTVSDAGQRLIWPARRGTQRESSPNADVASFVAAVNEADIRSIRATFYTVAPTINIGFSFGTSSPSASDVDARPKSAPIRNRRAAGTSAPSIGSNSLTEIAEPGRPLRFFGTSAPSIGFVSRATKIAAIQTFGTSAPSIGSLTTIRRHRLYFAAGVSAVSIGSLSETNPILADIHKIVVTGTSGPSIVSNSLAKGLKLRLPEVIRNIRLIEVGQDYAILAFDFPNLRNLLNLEIPIRFEVQFFGESWQDTGSLTPIYRLTSIGSTAIRAGQNYNVRFRAVNLVGNGIPSPVFSFDSGQVTLASPVVFPRFAVVNERIAEITYRPPSDLGGGEISHYQVAVISENGDVGDFEDTAGPVLRHQIRGLHPGRRFGFVVRPVNQAGPGVPSSPFYGVMRKLLGAPTLFEGQQILLIDALRQSLIIRLDDFDCRLSLWWQPRDEAWYASLEVPTNTKLVESQRLATNSGILDRVSSPLSGNIICRRLDVIDTFLEPGREAWSKPTHILVWENNL